MEYIYKEAVRTDELFDSAKSEFYRLTSPDRLTAYGAISFFISDSVANRVPYVDDILNDFVNIDHIVLTEHMYKKDRELYLVFSSKYILIIGPDEKKGNFFISSIIPHTSARWASLFRHSYSADVFVITLSAGIKIIRSYPTDSGLKITEYVSQNLMRQRISMMNFPMLLDAIRSFFCSKTDQKELVIGRRFQNLMTNFAKLTIFEDDVVRRAALAGDGLFYDCCQAITNSSNRRNHVYEFVCCMPPQHKNLFQDGKNVFISSMEADNSDLKGTIIDIIDYEAKELDIINELDSDDNLSRVQISFSNQFNHQQIPERGIIRIAHDETQKNVRLKVKDNINNFAVKSKYFYEFFNRFSSDGFVRDDEIGWQELHENLTNVGSGQFAPNPSQLNAIKKGIAVRDLHLVLGPPGTGKTTVIVEWVRYFYQNNMRVLISSQNNKAVDNVLERVAKDGYEGIIRIGNESKVSESVKEYMPDRLLDQASNKFEEDIARSLSFLGADISLIDITLDDVRNFERLLSDYFQAKDHLISLNMTIVGLIELAYDLNREKKRLARDINCNDNDLKALNRYIDRFNKSNPLKQFFFGGRFSRALQQVQVIERKNLAIHKEIENINNIYNTCLTSFNHFKEMKIRQKILADYRRLRNKIIKTTPPSVSLLSPDIGTISSDWSFADHITTDISTVKNYISRLEEYKERLVGAQEAIKDWQTYLDRNRNEILTDMMIENSKIVGATCIGINSRKRFAEIDFDVVIIDEAGQIQLHNVLVPMSRAPKCIMLGDHKQIPPIVNSEVAEMCEMNDIDSNYLKKSYFEILFEHPRFPEENKSVLDTQFRMPAEIADIISAGFYDNKYYSVDSKKMLTSLVPDIFSDPLVVISTSKQPANKQNEESYLNGGNRSYCNPFEAEIIVDLVERIFQKNPDILAEDIGIISFYSGQVNMIKNMLTRRLDMFERNEINEMVASVDSFQGQERDIIIISCTRSNKIRAKRNRIGFLKELRRLNVAFTRCKKQLIVIGDIDFLSECQSGHIEQFIDEADALKSEEIEEIDVQLDSEGDSENDNSEILTAPEQTEARFAQFITFFTTSVREGAGEFLSAQDLQERLRQV